MLFNTHFHNDHIWGNQSFAVQTDVVASEKTRRLIITEGPQELAWLRDGAEGI
jgi:glyoxylase-like metal-dependent hydrolase (beta-lactamase superfamily II)